MGGTGTGEYFWVPSTKFCSWLPDVFLIADIADIRDQMMLKGTTALLPFHIQFWDLQYLQNEVLGLHVASILA